MTKKSRVAGTSGDREISQELRDFFENQGFDTVKVVPYNVLLSFPNQATRNHVELYDRRDNLVFTSGETEDPASEDVDGDLPPFFAYSARGSPKVRHRCSLL